MTHADLVEWRQIVGKSVAVVEEHHHALVPWTSWWRRFGALRLVTIDHHSDTDKAFRFILSDHPRDLDWAKQQAMVAAIDPRSDASIDAAIATLRNDEHIDAAIGGGILDAAFVIAEQRGGLVKSREQIAYDARLQELERRDPMEAMAFWRATRSPEPPMTYAMPQDRIMAIDPPGYLYEGEYVDPWPDRVIEREHLNDRLAIFEQALAWSGEAPLEGNPYVLDIDMDAFRTMRSLHPGDATAFHRLIAGAVGVTIARERVCCRLTWKDGPLDIEGNFQTVLRHIDEAMHR